MNLRYGTKISVAGILLFSSLSYGGGNPSNPATPSTEKELQEKINTAAEVIERHLSNDQEQQALKQCTQTQNCKPMQEHVKKILQQRKEGVQNIEKTVQKIVEKKSQKRTPSFCYSPPYSPEEKKMKKITENDPYEKTKNKTQTFIYSEIEKLGNNTSKRILTTSKSCFDEGHYTIGFSILLGSCLSGREDGCNFVRQVVTEVVHTENHTLKAAALKLPEWLHELDQLKTSRRFQDLLLAKVPQNPEALKFLASRINSGPLFPKEKNML